MVTTVLIVILVLVSLMQPNRARLYAALCFSGLTALHDIAFSSLNGVGYYGSAALLDLAIILITSGINPVPRVVILLHFICMASILINFLGWTLWFFYLPPTAYNIVFILLYVTAIGVLLGRDGSDVGDRELDSWQSCFRFSRDTWANYINQYLGKI
jgi:uncharacterized membrane protein YjdF